MRDNIPADARELKLTDRPDGTGRAVTANRDQPGGHWWRVDGFPGMVETDELLDFGWPRVTHRFTEVPA